MWGGRFLKDNYMSAVEFPIMDPPLEDNNGHRLWHQLRNYYSTYYNDLKLPPEDNSHIKDKSRTPKVSFNRRFNCVVICHQQLGSVAGIVIGIFSSRLFLVLFSALFVLFTLSAT